MSRTGSIRGATTWTVFAASSVCVEGTRYGADVVISVGSCQISDGAQRHKQSICLQITAPANTAATICPPSQLPGCLNWMFLLCHFTEFMKPGIYLPYLTDMMKAAWKISERLGSRKLRKKPKISADHASQNKRYQGGLRALVKH